MSKRRSARGGAVSYGCLAGAERIFLGRVCAVASRYEGVWPDNASIGGARPYIGASGSSFGLQVHARTINDESTINMIDMGVDGIMTDDCALLKSVVVERNMSA